MTGGVVVGLSRGEFDTLLVVESQDKKFIRDRERCCVRVCEAAHRVNLYDKVRWTFYPPVVFWDALDGRGEIPLGHVGQPFAAPMGGDE